MLVKKPHADPAKPLAEQYRLVHNYVDLNKNINPCSYPLRHLYELLDEVASGIIFSVLDLSQGFFQQQLIDPSESTSFSIPGLDNTLIVDLHRDLTAPLHTFKGCLISYCKISHECTFTLMMLSSQSLLMRKT